MLFPIQFRLQLLSSLIKKTGYPRKLNENSPYFGIFLLEMHYADDKSSQNKLKIIFAIKFYQHYNVAHKDAT